VQYKNSAKNVFDIPIQYYDTPRSTSNAMDKGACNSANSKIQTWQPNTVSVVNFVGKDFVVH